jgi:hypothetical protein
MMIDGPRKGPTTHPTNDEALRGNARRGKGGMSFTSDTSIEVALENAGPSISSLANDDKYAP